MFGMGGAERSFKVLPHNTCIYISAINISFISCCYIPREGVIHITYMSHACSVDTPL